MIVMTWSFIVSHSYCGTRDRRARECEHYNNPNFSGRATCTCETVVLNVFLQD